MFVESDIDGAVVPEGSPDTMALELRTVVAAATLAVGLDLSRLSVQELESLRINDMVYLMLVENRRRAARVVEHIRLRHETGESDVRRYRGGKLGKAIHRLTTLDSDP